MAVKFTCDSCGEEVADGKLLYKIFVVNGNNTAIMNEANSPDLCENCAKLLLGNFLPIVEKPEVSSEATPEL